MRETAAKAANHLDPARGGYGRSGLFVGPPVPAGRPGRFLGPPVEQPPPPKPGRFRRRR